MKKLDARGMSCPEPVLMTKKAVESGEQTIEVMVDAAAAKNNVERFLKNSGYNVSISEEEDFFSLKGCK